MREIALRRTADLVDVDVRAYREEHGIGETWPAGERIVVGVGPSPSSARLIRAARRMAEGLRAPWTAVWVERPTPYGPADRERLEEHLRLAESLGGEVVRLAGTVPGGSDPPLRTAAQRHPTHRREAHALATSRSPDRVVR